LAVSKAFCCQGELNRDSGHTVTASYATKAATF
jgi:hypothetical protein